MVTRLQHALDVHRTDYVKTVKNHGTSCDVWLAPSGNLSLLVLLRAVIPRALNFYVRLASRSAGLVFSVNIRYYILI